MADHETYVDTFLGWDIISGKAHPELGGALEILDIVGGNNCSFGQMEYRENGRHAAMPPDDDRIKTLCDLLKRVWDRYQGPMIIAETSGMKEGRTDWLNDVMQESLAAVNMRIDLHGICLFPAVTMSDRHTGEWLQNGLFDFQKVGEDLIRVLCQEYIDELHRWQRKLNRSTELDDDTFSDPVELQDVIEAAND